jgi:hypothetical protein
MSTPVPTCPKCGGSKWALVSQRPVYAIADLSRTSPLATLIIYKCACSHEFSQRVPIDLKGTNPPKP